jgi:hypothetical protein
MTPNGPIRGGLPRCTGDKHGMRGARLGERFKGKEKMTALP